MVFARVHQAGTGKDADMTSPLTQAAALRRRADRPEVKARGGDMRVLDLMHRRGWTGPGLARRLGVTNQSVWLWLHGHRRPAKWARERITKLEVAE